MGWKKEEEEEEEAKFSIDTCNGEHSCSFFTEERCVSCLINSISKCTTYSSFFTLKHKHGIKNKKSWKNYRNFQQHEADISQTSKWTHHRAYNITSLTTLSNDCNPAVERAGHQPPTCVRVFPCVGMFELALIRC